MDSLQFSDLRVSLRMINHVYNIKLDQLKHRQEIKRLTDDIALLQADKTRLETMVKEIEDEHKQERDAWQAHETNLREFCSKAQGAYFGVAEYVFSHFWNNHSANLASDSYVLRTCFHWLPH